jgi:hypothetical protein
MLVHLQYEPLLNASALIHATMCLFLSFFFSHVTRIPAKNILYPVIDLLFEGEPTQSASVDLPRDAHFAYCQD